MFFEIKFLIKFYTCFLWDTLSGWILLRLMFGWFWALFSLDNITSWARLLVSGLISIFQLKGHLEIKDRSWWRTSALSSLYLTIVNRYVPSAKSFALDINWKRSGTRMKPWGTPSKTGLQDEACPFKTTLWSLPDKSFSTRLKRSPERAIYLSS